MAELKFYIHGICNVKRAAEEEKCVSCGIVTLGDVIEVSLGAIFLKRLAVVAHLLISA